MGSDDKPYPQEGNFVMNANPEMGVESREEMTEPNYSIGQAKYAVRGMGPSIYQDKTRYTADDYKACEVSDKGNPAPDQAADSRY